ncbi:BTAD domain-containing putative transcriptional regulator [Leisingera sp. D0M16]|uniref:BTAD domain-containing putative transcriptional regulator n=1 Tax=Leisingera coralii TaxID=3351347 RepID=UPI003B7AB86D
MDNQVFLLFFGGSEVRLSKGAASGLAKKSQALLAFLSMEDGRPATRERVATMLWGNTGDERARHNLRQALSQIRRVLGPAVCSDGDTLRLNTSLCDADVSVFVRSKDCHDVAELQEALELYRGDFLESFHVQAEEFETWARGTRERLRAMACTMIDRLAGKLVAQGADTEAEAALRRKLAIDPCCEMAHRALMELLNRQGRRSEAMRQFKLCGEALQRDLDTTPSPETQAVFDAISNSGLSALPGTPSRSETASSTGKPVVAVLPFENLSDESDLYFSDGITEDLTTALSRFSELELIARPSSFRYRGRATPEDEVASALGASFLVRGSVRRSGDAMRISVQLLSAERGTAIWAEQYNRQMGDVFKVQTEIVSTVVSTLVGRVESARLMQSRGLDPQRLEAYDILLRGKYHHHLFTAADCRKCLDLFRLAISKDPDYALAHAWLACGLGQAIVHKLDDPARLVDQSQAAAEHGLELDENESECHRVLAQNHLTRGNVRRALWHQERALFLNPNDDRSLCAMGEILTFAGEPVAGEEWVRKSMRLNPYHPERYWSHLARALFHQQRFEETLRVFDRISRKRADDLVYLLASSAKTGSEGELERARAAVRTSGTRLDPVEIAQGFPLVRAKDRDLLLGALKLLD